MTPEKYRPSNGAEGDWFMSRWCENCQRDRSIREGIPADQCEQDELCDIIVRTFIHDIEEPEYPVEWIRDDNGPRCTAFVPVGEKVAVRCDKTIDMFDGEPK